MTLIFIRPTGFHLLDIFNLIIWSVKRVFVFLYIRVWGWNIKLDEEAGWFVNRY